MWILKKSICCFYRGLIYCAVHPQSIVQQAPVIDALILEQRYSTRLAISFGSIIFLIAADLSMIFSTTSSSGILCDLA